LRKTSGFHVVLTADRTLMAGYRLLFDGMVAASQTTTAPVSLVGGFLMPAGGGSGRARVAPLGLRRIEAALLDAGFGVDDVAVVDGDHLADAIGPATRIAAVSSGEPLGLGMNTSTMTAVAGGSIYPAAMFRSLMRQVRRLVAANAPGAKVVMGGPGAWQLAGRVAERRELGIDHVVTGYAEGNVAEIFRAILRGDAQEAVIAGEGVPPARIPRIRGASTMGVVEISRGCGLGCGFCTIGRVPMIHLPDETILADARTNVAAGVDSIAMLSEDFFRYGAAGLKVNPQALIALLRRVRGIDGLRLIQIDHANILSVSQFGDDELRSVRELLAGPSGLRFLWVNVGIETASGRLLGANGGGAKMGRLADDWPAACAAELRRLCRAGFFPLASLVLGVPGETPEDVRATLAWVESLRGERLAIFPMLNAPIDGTPPPGPRDLTALHWRLIRACYRFNFAWVPRMYWDNQSAAGVGLLRRALTQVMGQGQMLEWKTLFALRSMGAR